MAELMPLRPVCIVWEDDPEAKCEWCGNDTFETWVIVAAPLPHEKFCSPQCVASDTGMCWEPNDTCRIPDWMNQ